MALSFSFSLSEIKNYEQVCLDLSTLNLTKRTNTLVCMMLCIGIGRITKDNYKEVFFRLRCLERVHGDFLFQLSGSGVLVPEPFKLQHVYDHIGLSTNVSSWSEAKFWKEIKAGITLKLEDEIETQMKELKI